MRTDAALAITGDARACSRCGCGRLVGTHGRRASSMRLVAASAARSLVAAGRKHTHAYRPGVLARLARLHG